MKELSNFLPISRKLFENKLWKEKREFSKAEAWIDLIQTARYKDEKTTEIIDGKLCTWGRGQLIASYRFLAKRWGWKSLNKVRHFLVLLEKCSQIETGKEQGLTLITLCNYESYNGEGNSEGTQKEQRGNSNGTAMEQNSNIDNIEKNVIITPPAKAGNDFINDILNLFLTEYRQVYGTEYVVVNKGKDRSAIGKLLNHYKSTNTEKKTSEQTLQDFRLLFKRAMLIDDTFLRDNMSPAIILNKLNFIKTWREDNHKNGNNGKHEPKQQNFEPTSQTMKDLLDGKLG